MGSMRTRGYDSGRRHGRGREGFTLVEMLLVVALMGGVMAALIPVLRAVSTGWQVGERRIEVVQNARVGLDKITRDMREMRRVSAVSAPGDGDGFIEFYDCNDDLQRVEIDGDTGYVVYGPPGDEALLAGPVQSLTFECFDMAGEAMADPVDPIKVRAVAVDMTVADADDRVPPYTLGNSVFMRRDVNVVINEIMYNPLAISNEQRYEWIELYNPSDEAVDVAGWGLSSRLRSDETDTITGDERWGSGVATVPVDGFAVITPQNNRIYWELLLNRGFENSSMWMWPRSGGWSRVKDGDVHEGQRKLVRNGPGWIRQFNLMLPFANSIFFSFWEKTPDEFPNDTNITVTVRDWWGRVLATTYDGPMHAEWTRHMADLTPYQWWFISIQIETTGPGTYWIDDFTLNWSWVDAGAVRLCVQDNHVAGRLHNSWDNVLLTQFGTIADLVNYDDDWGGDGNSRTIERISATGGGSDPDNWDEGPWIGTPGWINEASQ